jgi:hypothetical protein
MGKKKNKEIRVQTSQEEDSFIAAEEKWQEEFEAEERYKDELRAEGAKLERERLSNSLDDFIKPLIEKAFTNSANMKAKTKANKKEEIFTILGLDTQRLLSDLESKGFFDRMFKDKVLDWFNGQPPLEPIPVNASAAEFVSIIADMMDLRPRFIHNTKEFVYNYIAISFLFKGKKCEVSTIKQIMKPGNIHARVSHHTGTIPNILDFKTNPTT